MGSHSLYDNPNLVGRFASTTGMPNVKSAKHTINMSEHESPGKHLANRKGASLES